MSIKILPLLIFSSLMLCGCSKSSFIDSNKTGSTTSKTDLYSTSQLTDQDVFGNELTLEISEEDIQNAVEEASGFFEIPINSSIVLVQSGARAPDAIMQKEMQRYYQVATFSGIPVAKKKRAVQPVATVKESTTDDAENFAASQSGVINANYMQAMRYIAAKGRQKAVVVYWGELEMGKYSSAKKEIAWKKYAANEKLPGASLRYLIRFALVDVATGEWATYSPANTEIVVVPSTVKKGGDADITEQQLIGLKQKACKMVVDDLVSRYGRG
jgi:hypothetical protein